MLPVDTDTPSLENSKLQVKKRGRPRKNFNIDPNHHSTPIIKNSEPQNAEGQPKKRGRPRKIRPEPQKLLENDHQVSHESSLVNNSVIDHNNDGVFDDEQEDREENIEIVFEDISSQNISTNNIEEESKNEIKSSTPELNEAPEEYLEKAESPEINLEIIENCGSNGPSSPTPAPPSDEPMQVSKESSPDQEELINGEDEVNIVIFDESENRTESGENSEKNRIIITSDSDTDSTVTDLSDYNYKRGHSFSQYNSPSRESHEPDASTPTNLKEIDYSLESDMKKINIEDEKMDTTATETLPNGLISNQCSESEADDLDCRSQESDNDQVHPPVSMNEQDETVVRRSRRIKKISSKKKRSVGHGLVKERDWVTCTEEPGNESTNKSSSAVVEQPPKTQAEIEEEEILRKETEERLKKFVDIQENEYKCDRNVSKDAKKMLCDCFLTEDEIQRGELGCGEDCLNRLLMIECGVNCNVGDRCTNQQFQKKEYSECTVFRTEKKGFGVLAARPIQPGQFIMEYVGEVLDSEQFEKRAAEYSKIGNQHYYFMALRSDAIIDATTRGNISRFINHSCDPNAETQKWTVNGELRIGFFSTRYIPAGEELTFDYQLQRYG